MSNGWTNTPLLKHFNFIVFCLSSYSFDLVFYFLNFVSRYSCLFQQTATFISTVSSNLEAQEPMNSKGYFDIYKNVIQQKFFFIF